MKITRRLVAFVIALLMVFVDCTAAIADDNGVQQLDIDTYNTWLEASQSAENQASKPVYGIGYTNKDSVPLYSTTIIAIGIPSVYITNSGTALTLLEPTESLLNISEIYAVRYNGSHYYVKRTDINAYTEMPECDCDNSDLSLTSHADTCTKKQYIHSICDLLSAEEIFNFWGSYDTDVHDHILEYLSWTNQAKGIELRALVEAESVEDVFELLKECKTIEELKLVQTDYDAEHGEGALRTEYEKLTEERRAAVLEIFEIAGEDFYARILNVTSYDDYSAMKNLLSESEFQEFFDLLSDEESAAANTVVDSLKKEIVGQYNSYTVKIDGVIPENSQISIVSVSQSTADMLSDRIEMSGLRVKRRDTFAIDIKINNNGVEWQPDGSVRVKLNAIAPNADRVRIVHLLDSVEAIEQAREAGYTLYTLSESDSVGFPREAEAGNGRVHYTISDSESGAVSVKKNGDIEFTTSAFSTFFFTVDFYYGTDSYSLEGLDDINLSDLFDQLGIDEDATNARSVRFSNPELLAVQPVYEEDGDRIIDWKLTSLAPFTSDETLTIVLADGDEIIINVQDAQMTYFNIHVVVMGMPNPNQKFHFKLEYYDQYGNPHVDEYDWGNGDGISPFYCALGYPVKITQVHQSGVTYENWIQQGGNPQYQSDTFYENPMTANHVGENICFYVKGNSYQYFTVTKNVVNGTPGAKYKFLIFHQSPNAPSSYKGYKTIVELENGETASIPFLNDIIGSRVDTIYIAELTYANSTDFKYSKDGSALQTPSTGDPRNWSRVKEDVYGQNQGAMDAECLNYVYPFYTIKTTGANRIDIVVTNSYPVKRNLTVTKNLVNEASGKTFYFEAQVQGESSKRTFSIKGGQSYTLTNIPDGASVTVKETGVSSGTLSSDYTYTSQQTIVVSGSDKSLTFTNTRKLTDLSLSKTVYSTNSSDGPFTYTITVKDENNAGVNLSSFNSQQPAGVNTVNAANGQLTVTFSNMKSGVARTISNIKVPLNCKVVVTESFTGSYKVSATGGNSTSTDGKTVTINKANGQNVVYTNELPVVYNYIPVTSNGTTKTTGSTTGGTVSLGTESVYPKTGTVTGSTATAKSGYKFDGWFLNEACTQYASSLVSGNKLTPIKENGLYTGGTYYALFSPANTQYTVKHLLQDRNNPTVYNEVVADREVVQNVPIGSQTEAEANTYTGYLAQPFVQQTVVAGGTTVVEIRYNLVPHTIEYIVENDDPSADRGPETKYYGDPIDDYNPTQPGYEFDGWYTDPDYENPWTKPDTMPDADIVVYGRFLEYKLTIKKNGMKSNESAIFTVSGSDGTTYKVTVCGNGGSVTIAGLSSNVTYTVTEDSNWSWRYESTASQSVTVVQGTSGYQLTFTNTPKDNQKWLDHEAYAHNEFGQGSN